MEEKEYRKKVSETFAELLKVLDNIDPDVVEAELSQGALTLLSKDGSKTILSQQPSVSQIWLAMASQGRAIHFNWNEAKKSWFDDKGQGLELISTLEEVLKGSTGQKISLKTVA